MRLFGRKRRGRHRVEEADDDDRIVSPFDADEIRPGDPAWEIFQRAMQTGQPVVGTYDTRTGEIVEMRDL